jgi:hypothetical protein
MTTEVLTSQANQIKVLAAIAYGEASVADDPDEIAALAWAVVNRSKAWGKTISEMLAKDPDYTYAADGSNVRFNKLMKSSESEITAHKGMNQALEAAKKAFAREGSDPSNGAFWWDGEDIKSRYRTHEKVQMGGIRFTDPAHNIYDIQETSYPTNTYWESRNRRTGAIVRTPRGHYDHKYDSTAAYGGTIFWKTNDEYVRASGAKSYK